MSKVIIKKESVVFNYETEESSFFQCENRELNSELDYRFVIDYLKNHGENGIDIIIGAEEIGYIKYTTTTRNGCGLVIVKYTNDEKTECSHVGTGVKRYCEKARNIMAADLRDMVKDAQENTDWDMDFFWYENDAMCELNDTIDTISNGIRDIENKIEKEVEYGTWTDSVLIGGYAQNVFDLLIAVKIAVHEFLQKMSDYTDCNFKMADAYGALVLETGHMGFTIDESMDIEGEFYHWLHDIFKNCENGTDMADTLYHYIAVA